MRGKTDEGDGIHIILCNIYRIAKSGFLTHVKAFIYHDRNETNKNKSCRNHIVIF